MGKLAVIWRSADLLLAINAQAIVEILPPVSCRAAFGTPDWVRGLFLYRGTLTPMVDAASLLGTGRQPDRMSNRVLVVRSENNTSSDESVIGLWVETVMEIDRLDFDAPGCHPGFSTSRGRFLGPVAQTRWGQVQLLSPHELIANEQVGLLRQRLPEAPV